MLLGGRGLSLNSRGVLGSNRTHLHADSRVALIMSQNQHHHACHSLILRTLVLCFSYKTDVESKYV